MVPVSCSARACTVCVVMAMAVLSFGERLGIAGGSERGSHSMHAPRPAVSKSITELDYMVGVRPIDRHRHRHPGLKLVIGHMGEALDPLPVSPADSAKIAHGNADRLLRLPTGHL